jgi:hypothetical protein
VYTNECVKVYSNTLDGKVVREAIDS